MLWGTFTALVDAIVVGSYDGRNSLKRMVDDRRGGVEVLVSIQPVGFGCPAEAEAYDQDKWTRLVRAFDRLATPEYGVPLSTVRMVDSALGRPRRANERQLFWTLDADRTLFVRGENELNHSYTIGVIVRRW
jgi:hypothetical protein